MQTICYILSKASNGYSIQGMVIFLRLAIRMTSQRIRKGHQSVRKRKTIKYEPITILFQTRHVKEKCSHNLLTFSYWHSKITTIIHFQPETYQLTRSYYVTLTYVSLLKSFTEKFVAEDIEVTIMFSIFFSSRFSSTFFY